MEAQENANAPASESNIVTLASVSRFAYVIGASRDGPLKVGVALKPWERLVILQTGHPERLQCFWMDPTPRGDRVERIAHQILAPSRMTGEWFDVPLEVAISAVAVAAIVLDEGRGLSEADLIEYRADVGAQCNYEPYRARKKAAN